MNLWMKQPSHSFAAPGYLTRLFRLLSGKSAQQGYLAAMDQAVISLGNFVATVLLARYISPTELGVYGVGFTSLRLVRSIQEGLTIQPLNAFGAGMREQEFRTYASRTTLIQLALALITSLGALGLGGLLIYTGNDTAGPGVLALWAPFFGWQFAEYLRRMLYCRGRIGAALVNTLISNMARLALMLVWLQTSDLNGAKGLYAIGLGALPAALLSLWQTRAYWSESVEHLPETLKQNWLFGRWIIGGTLANWFSAEFYPVLTAGMISFAAAGAYRALQNLVAPIHLLLRAVDTYFTPRAASDYQINGITALKRSLRLIYALSGLPILLALLIAVILRAPLLELLYGETYLPYQNGVPLMALFYALWFAYWPLQAGFKAVQNSQPIFLANLSAIVAMFTLGLAMIYHWGVYGTIAGQALNAAIVALILWLAWVYRKNNKG